ncbi:MAG: putative ribosomal protein L11 methyltransferase [Parcubacteria group bacterium LiPW_41]|nr:MAG: putative ribosomal protein L11 methyltransferase [Parcubacteria group bacterium LiPW_41]
MQYITFFFLIITLLVITGVIYSLWRLLFKKNHAPFIPIPHDAIPSLVEHADINKGDVVYDLGCGDARILKILAKKYSDAQFIGIEKALFPYIIAKISSLRFPNITIRRKNFFKIPIANATVVITYLFPSVMDLLLPKFEKELHNTKLLSFDFPFSKKEYETMYVIKERQGKLGSKIFIYRFE